MSVFSNGTVKTIFRVFVCAVCRLSLCFTEIGRDFVFAFGAVIPFLTPSPYHICTFILNFSLIAWDDVSFLAILNYKGPNGLFEWPIPFHVCISTFCSIAALKVRIFGL